MQKTNKFRGPIWGVPDGAGSTKLRRAGEPRRRAPAGPAAAADFDGHVERSARRRMLAVLERVVAPR
jgi:hypothetical protein